MPASTGVTLSFLCCFLFAIVHLLAGKLRFLEGIPRSRWLSLAGGVSVAYVFVHLLPELSEGQEAFEEAPGLPFVVYLEHHAYLIALAGLVMFYGLERAARLSREQGPEDATAPRVFWLHVASFSLYNALIGYLLVHREEQDMWGLLWYALAMALHFVVNDFGLREHHKHRYHHTGRWMLAVAVFVGWGLGIATRIHEPALAALFSFLAGGVILNVLKEELPEERKSRFWAFALGGGLYAALLLASA